MAWVVPLLPIDKQLAFIEATQFQEWVLKLVLISRGKLLENYGMDRVR